MQTKSKSIAFRLKIGFALIIAMMIVTFIFSAFELREERILVDEIYLHPYTVSNAARNIQTNVAIMHSLIDSSVTHKHDEQVNLFITQDLVNSLITNEHDAQVSSEASHKHELNKDVTHVDSNITKEHVHEHELNKAKVIEKLNKYDIVVQQDFKIISQQYLGSKNDIKKAYSLYEQHKIMHTKILGANNEETKILMLKKAGQHIHILNDSLGIIIKFANNKAKELYRHAQEHERKMILSIIVIAFACIILGILIALTTIKSIVVPLNNLTKFTERVRDGDLTLLKSKDAFKLVSRNDEIGLLFKSFSQLMRYLLLPYKDIIYGEGSIVKKTQELRRLLNSFDRYVIASKTDAKGNFIYASKAFQAISGYSLEELMGKPYTMVYHEDMQKEIFSDIWKTVENGKSWIGEIKNKTKTGGYYWVIAHLSADIDEEKNIIGYNSIQENNTSTKAHKELLNTLETRIADEVQKNQEQANHMLKQSRLAQMGEMISMIAHQWRQPLASISAVTGTLSLDIMMDNYNKTFFQERLESINELSQYLSGTIDDFRSFFKDDKEEKEANIDQLVNECLNIIGPILKNKNIKITIDIEKEVIIKTYINELKQVILNILKNAEDALLEKKVENATISIKGYKKESNAYITIEDNAGGVPDEIIDKVFDPYFSTKKQKDGTGLGLYMSKTIVEEHCRGALMVKNTKFGAKFIIKIQI